MSIPSQTERDTLTIERLAVTQSSTGGQIRTYSTAGRGNLPTIVCCRIQPLASTERLALGVRTERLAWKLLFHSDPLLTVADRVTFIDADQQSRTAQVVEPSRNLDNQSRLYRAIVEEVGNEA